MYNCDLIVAVHCSSNVTWDWGKLRVKVFSALQDNNVPGAAALAAGSRAGVHKEQDGNKMRGIRFGSPPVSISL